MNIVTIDGLPVYQALVDGEDTGMLRISLVDDPAVQSNFVAFDKQKAVLKYAIQDEEKRLVLGVVMRADFPIFRRDPKMGEYYIIYKADTIRTMAEKYLLENRQNEVNLNHEDGSEVEGVQMVQYFIKGSGIQPEGFEDIADGSLFAEFHVINDEVWDAIKAGTYRGFSLEGIFELAPERDKDFVQDVVDALDGVFSRHNKNTKKDMKTKGLLARIAQALAEEINMGNVTTDKGILAWDGSENLKEGDSVFVEDSEGNRTPAADGAYTTTDGKVINVEGGKVTSITDGQAEVAPEEAAAEEVKAGEVSTDKGTLEWDGEEDLRAGDAVFTRDENGERVPAADGEYTTEDGKVIAVVDGVVASIEDPNAEVDEEGAQQTREEKMQRVIAALSETYEDKYRRIYKAIVALGFDPYGWVLEAGDEFAIYEVWNEEHHYFRFKITKWDEEGNPVLENGVEVFPTFVTAEEKEEIEANFAAEKTARETAEARVVELEAQVAKLSKEPAAKSAHEEVENALLVTGNKGLDRISAIMGARAKK